MSWRAFRRRIGAFTRRATGGPAPPPPEVHRASVGGIGPLPLSFPTPDGTINAGDREQMAALYRGLASGG